MLAGKGVWSTGGPFGGGATALAVDPATPSTIYAGAGRAVFKSTDAGATWGPGRTQSADVIALMVDSKTPSIVYAVGYGSGSSGIAKSTDGGLTWLGLLETSNRLLRTLVIDPKNPAIVYAGGGDFFNGLVLKSTDAGDHWSQPGPRFPAPISALVVDSTTPSALYAAAAAPGPGGVFRSTDSGATWVEVDDGLGTAGAVSVQELAIDPRVPSRLYAATAAGLFRSTDSGGSWLPTEVSSPFVANVVVDPQTPAVIYAAKDDGVLRSSDAGATWDRVSEGLTEGAIRELALSPSNPGTLYAASNTSVFTTNDSAQSWRALQGFQPLAINVLAIDATHLSTIYAGTPSGVFKSLDSGRSWARASTGLPASYVSALAIDPRRSSTVYAGTFGGGVARSTDAGGTWEPANTGFPVTNVFAANVHSLAADPATPSTLYAALGDGNLFQSTDSGGSWAQANLNGRSFGTCLVVDPATPSILYASNDWSGLGRSTDSGRTWVAANAGLTNLDLRALVIDPTNPSRLYAGTNGGGVSRSTDAGLTWTAASSGLAAAPESRRIWALAIDVTAPNTLCAATLAGVFRSSDSGSSWVWFGGSVPPYAAGFSPHWEVTALAIDPSSATVYAGTPDTFISTTASPSELPGGVWQYTPRTPEFELLLSRQRIAVDVRWRDPSSGREAQAYPIQRLDDFGYFGFASSSHPDVFVKVLDFGTGGPLCFVGGFTNFEYEVTFTALATGESLIFFKPVGMYVGFADNGSLRFAPTLAASVTGHDAVTGLPPDDEPTRSGFEVSSPALVDSPNLLLSGGRVSVTAEWKSPYDGLGGTAFGIAESDEFGFFYFTDSSNPEIFVRVLDGDQGTAISTIGGLSDFGYRVTLTVLRTGQTMVFEKPAGSLAGFHDDGALRF